MVKKEYAIWGTRNGQEDIIKINGQEIQDNLSKAKMIKNVLVRRGDFQKVRIQSINMENWNIKSSFTRGIRHKR